MTKAIVTMLLALSIEPLSSFQVGVSGRDGANRSGVAIRGWTVLFDAADVVTDRVFFRRMEGGMHVTSATAAILWQPRQMRSGEHTVSAFFTAAARTDRLQTYGVFVNGLDLGGPSHAWVAFTARQDGRFSIERVDGSEHEVLIAWAETPALRQPDAQGNLYNQLVVQVGHERVQFLANGMAVSSLPGSGRGDRVAAGLRVLDGADVHIRYFRIVDGIR